MKSLIVVAILASSVMSPAFANVSLVSGTGNPQLAVVGGSQATFADVGTGRYASLATTGITFSTPGAEFAVSDDYAGQFNSDGRSLQGSFDSNAFQSLAIDFAAPVEAVAFNYGAADTNWLLEGFDAAGRSLGAVVLLPTQGGNAGTFYGIASSAQDIARAVLSVDLAHYNPATPHPDYIFIDNVTTGQFAAAAPPVPEPGEWAMMAAGLAIVGGLARRRRTARA